MTPTHYLLASLAVICALCLVAIFFCKMISTEWQRADEPAYRTADGNAIRRQTKRIIANAAAHTSASNTFAYFNSDTVRREGIAAAIADMGRKPGTPPIPNPHPSDTLAHFLWRDSYDKVSKAAEHDVDDDCLPNHRCLGRVVHLSVGEQCDKCGAA